MSSALIQPIATPTILGTPVRFFKAPLPQPHLPWHSLEDMHRALRLPRDLRKQLLRRSRSFPDGEFKTVATRTGPVVIGSHPMALGLLGAVIEMPNAPAGLEEAYFAAASEALKALGGDLPPMARVALALAAARNTLGIEIGGVA